MIPFTRDEQTTIPDSQVKIIGLGGAGANMLDRVALDGMEGASLLAVNTDVRTLQSSVANEKVQIGRNLTRGLGCGGDPLLGQQAVQEVESEIRESVRDHKIIFLCVGLGGGTGSGAAPVITRIAREEGAFVVIFATMPFSFEGQRRRDQASTALNELAALSNALVTFDNGRMGELVLAKQGIHEAFSAADRMISDSIRAVTRLVIRPGLINVGLDDLMTALRTTRSRCLFGSGLGSGQSRSQQALKKALSSPLLDRGSLLEDAETVLVHVCGGDNLTLYEVELLMRGLTKNVPEGAQILFGAAIDPGMGDSLSVTIISSLPEEKLQLPQTPTITVANDAFIDEVEEETEEESAEDLFVEEVVAETAAPEFVEAAIEEESFAVEKEIEEEPEEPANDKIALFELEEPEESPEEVEEAVAEVIIEPEEEEPIDSELPDDEETVAAVSEEVPFDPTDDIPALAPTSGFSAEDLVGDIVEEEQQAVAEAEKERQRAAAALEAPESKPRRRTRKAASPEPRGAKGSAVTEVAKPELDAQPTAKQGKKNSQFELEFDLEGGPKYDAQPTKSIDGEDLNIPAYLRRKREG